MKDFKDIAPEKPVEMSQLQEFDVANRRRGVLVLGMHRSGTSALSGMLGKLGCALPKDLLGAGIGNEKGHWEPQGIVALNDRILASAGSHWEDWVKFNPDWYKSPLYLPLLKEAGDSLRTSFKDAPLFVLKDPRICRIVPFWLAAFKAEAIEPALVLCLRDPTDVAASLAARDGMELGYAYLLWLRYMLEAEVSTRGWSRAICSFDQLMQDWAGTAETIGAELGISWPRKSASAFDEIDKFLSPGANFSKESFRRAMPDWAIRACTILQKWTVRGEDQADYEELDEIRKAFDKASEVFASLILPGSRSLGAGGAKAMQEGFTQEIGEHLARIGFLEREAEQLKSELGEALEESQERQRGHEALVGELEKAKAALEAELDGLRQSVENHLTENRLREEDQAATMQRFEIAESTLRQREEEIEQTRGELARMGDLLTAHEALATDREAELETAREEMEIVSRQAEAARADLRRADQEDIALRQEHAAKVASLEQDHATKFADAMERLKDANYRCQNSQNRIAEQSRESAVMTGLLLEAEQARDHRTEMLDWLAKTDTVLSTVPFWWHLMPARWKARRMHGRLLHHGLFDAKAYLALYPDVVAARIDPLRHFIQHGMNEGRRLTR